MKGRRGNRGMALLLVLVIVALLTSLLTDLAFSTMVDMRLTETFRDSTGPTTWPRAASTPVA